MSILTSTSWFESAKNIFNRILFLLSQQGNDIYNALVKGSMESVKNIYPSTHNTRKFILYYLRLVSRSDLPKNESKIRKSKTKCHKMYKV